jgi:hypothetical protein
MFSTGFFPRTLLVLSFFMVSILGFSQSYEVVLGDTINRIDTANRKQGLWKYWDNNLSLVLMCYYDNDMPVGKQTYYKKNKTILELEPSRSKSEIVWKYYGSGKLVQGVLRKGKKKFEFLNKKGEKPKNDNLPLFVSLIINKLDSWLGLTKNLHQSISQESQALSEYGHFILR